MKIIELKIKGMTCPSCSASVERLVNNLDGVKEQNISHEDDLGVFTIDENIVSESELIAKINEGHYKVEMPEKIIELKIKGMTCPSCSASVERLVNNLDGVKEQNVSHENDLGVFKIDENILSESDLIAKINEGHYKVEMTKKIIQAEEKIVPVCPVCKNSGQLVSNTVFKSNLKVESQHKVNLEAENYICMDADCLVAYYSGENTISKDELKRELWYKKDTKTVLACYCNNISTEQIKEAISQHNLTSWEEITSHYRKKVIEKCETLNPTGYCCRDNFDKLVTDVKGSLKNDNKLNKNAG